jgi:hypothetical protein
MTFFGMDIPFQPPDGSDGGRRNPVSGRQTPQRRYDKNIYETQIRAPLAKRPE